MNTNLQKEKRGASILLLSIVLMFVLLLLSITLFNLIPVEMHAANRSQQDLNGHYVARAGIQETMSWLKFQIKEFDESQDEADLPDYSTNGTSFPNIEDFVEAANARRPFDNGDWRYELEIIPQQNTFGLTNNFESRLYAVRSTAFFNDRPIRRIDVLLRQKTFASFAFYTEQFDSNSKMVMTGESSIFGPVHTNDWFRFDATQVANANWSAEPYFTDVVTHSKTDPNSPSYGDGNTWLGGTPYDTNGAVAGRYESIFEGGRNDLRLKNAIDLPSSTDTVLATTWPDAATRPTDAGTYVSRDANGKVNGGIVINGNAQEVNLRLDKYGNQDTRVKQGFAVGTNSKVVTKYKNVSYNPKKYTSCNGSCKKYGTPPSGSGGGGGVGGGNAASNAPCLEYNIVQCEVTYQVEDGTQTRTSTDTDQFETQIIEVTENPITAADGLVDATGAPVTAPLNSTVVIKRVTVQAGDTPLTLPDGTVTNYKTYNGTNVTIPSSGSVTKVTQVEVLPGQINGNIYASGRIGGAEGHRAGNSENGVGALGLWGIAKGSAVLDENGNFKLDTEGNKTYANKAIVTPLNQGNSISVGGDLLQFSSEKFKALKASNANYNFAGQNSTTKVRNWTAAALDPNRVTNGKPDPERSPNADHVLGLISLDIWMKGPNNQSSGNTISKNSNTGKELTANDGYSDCYFVALAGKTELNAQGDPIIVNGDTKTSGGFGTWREHRDNLNDGLGEFRVIGGVIQGTVGKNYNDNGANDTHHWIDGSGSVGYNLGMFYDIEATNQRIFPVQADFSIVRLFESTARERN